MFLPFDELRCRTSMSCCLCMMTISAAALLSLVLTTQFDESCLHTDFLTQICDTNLHFCTHLRWNSGIHRYSYTCCPCSAVFLRTYTMYHGAATSVEIYNTRKTVHTLSFFQRTLLYPTYTTVQRDL